MKHDLRSRLGAYAAVVACVLAAFCIRLALTPLLGDHAPLIWFALPAMIGGWYGGLWVGLLTMITGGILGHYFFILPFHNIDSFGPATWTESLAYYLVTGASLFIIEGLRRAQLHAEKSAVLAQKQGEQLRDRLREISEAESRIEQLTAIVESAPDAIISIELSGQIKTWNQRAEELFGHAAADMIGRSLVELVPLDRQPEHRNFCERLERGERVPAFETVRLTKDGRELQVSISASPIHGLKGEPIGAWTLTHDVTELRCALSSLRESEERFRILADATPLMIWMTDADKKCSWVNRTRLRFTGRSLDQEMSGGLIEAVHPEDRARWQQSYVAASDRRQPFEIEYRLQKHDGEYRWVLDQGVPYFTKSGSFVGYLGCCMDVTERKQAEEALESRFDELRATQHTLQAQNEQLALSRQALELERSRYRELFDSAPVGYILTNPQGIIQKVNQAAADLLHEDQQFLIGLPFARLLAREERAVFFANLGRLTRREVPRIENWEALMQPHNEPAFPSALLVNLVQDQNDQLTGLRWIVRDITERKQAEEKVLRLNAELEERVSDRTAALEKANRELEAFSYSVSHDLRAPLRSITGFSTALLEEYADKLDEQGAKYLRFAHDAGLRMTRLIEDLMELSRATRAELRQQEVDLTALATLVVTELRKREPRRAVEVDIAPSLRAHGDEGLLRIALENLLGNAWKFTNRQSQPRIEVGSFERDGARLYFVRDNGAGFDMAQVNRLFGVFQRLHSQDEFPGTGIGLATVRRIFNRHGGEVWAESKISEGATFYFTLPDAHHRETGIGFALSQPNLLDGRRERPEQPIRSAA